MKKHFLLLSAFLLLTACETSSTSQSSSDSSPSQTVSSVKDDEIMTEYYTLTYSYDPGDSTKVLVLYNDSITPFINVKDYGYEKEPIPGDSICLKYTGEIFILETYPSTAYLKELKEIISVEVFEARIFEFTYTDSKLISTDNQMAFCNVDNVINEDNSITPLEELEEGTTLYGINPASFSSLNCIYLCSFNPRS